MEPSGNLVIKERKQSQEFKPDTHLIELASKLYGKIKPIKNGIEVIFIDESLQL